ncbi:substrate-binding periplasmic protein [Aestuariispira insulae]|uniref:Amino acid ABC transporter substrate-binding protein (PAAT family) n=1 Tax=Aestuariispira insulae TaxID=1461337 RepID=A0A3D9HRX0_9PROT|nr:transporter substrate-binding domain-containing protein [Aestuariispira insulae]RED52248.1 amino acid ABC transporter substrate-binding protein (PAAT family) [Aestuariispira insulae]
MIRLFSLIGLTTLLWGACPPPALAKDDRHVTFVAYSASEPLIIAKKNRVRGIITDVVRQIFRETPYQLEYQQIPSEKFLRLLESGLDSNWITYGSPAWHKDSPSEEQFEFSEQPLFELHYSLVSSKPAIKVSKIQDLIGRRLVLIQGYRYPELEPYLHLDSDRGGIIPFYVTSRTDAMIMIAEHRADFFLSGTKRAHWSMHAMGYSHDEISLQDFSHQIPAQPVHLSFNRNAPAALKRHINRRLGELLASDLLPRLIRHYNYGEDYPDANG